MNLKKLSVMVSIAVALAGGAYTMFNFGKEAAKVEAYNEAKSAYTDFDKKLKQCKRKLKQCKKGESQ